MRTIELDRLGDCVGVGVVFYSRLAAGIAADPDGLQNAALADDTIDGIPTKWVDGTMGTGVDTLNTRFFDSKAPVTLTITTEGGAYDGTIGDVLSFGIYYSTD